MMCPPVDDSHYSLSVFQVWWNVMFKYASDALSILKRQESVYEARLKMIVILCRHRLTYVLGHLSDATDSNSYAHSYTDGGGCHVRSRPAHQEQFGVSQYLAQGHFDTLTRGIEPAPYPRLENVSAPWATVALKYYSQGFFRGNSGCLVLSRHLSENSANAKKCTKKK